MFVNNLTEYARKKRYIVVRIVDGEAWYFAAMDEFLRAQALAQEIDGVVVPIIEAEG